MRSAIRITMLFVLAAFAGCGDTVAQVAPAPAELAVNGGFEAAGAGGLPSGWVRDMAATGEKGTAARDTARARGGGASLKLVPNARNGGNTPLAVSQVISLLSCRNLG